MSFSVFSYFGSGDGSMLLQCVRVILEPEEKEKLME